MSQQNIEKAPPSLDLSFDWVKGVLDGQAHSVDALDTKIMTLFSLGTVVLGVGSALGGGKLSSTAPLPLIFVGLSFVAYVCVIGLAVAGLWVRGFEFLRNPITIREWYWQMTPTKFKVELLVHLEDAYTSNQAKLDKKGRTAQLLVPIVGLEVAFLILTLWLL